MSGADQDRTFDVGSGDRRMDRERLSLVDTSTLWHPFTQMQAYAAEQAPIIVSGEGVTLRDIEGRSYLDGISSLWCNVHGHRRPEIDEAIRRQLDLVAHSTLLGLGSVPSIELAERLAALTHLPHVFYADSGASAVEIAMKVCFQYMRRTRGEKRTKFLAFRNAYHGDTLGAVAVGGIDVFHAHFSPLLFPVVFAPSPYAYRWPGADCRDECLAAFHDIADRHADELAGVVLEPMVQGAAGMIIQPPGFVSAIRRWTTEHGIPFIADEVATGFGRTGRMFAVEHEAVRPDALVLGKGISAGYLPLSAVCFSEEIYSSFLGEHAEMKHFLHGHTYTGNALACAAGLASLDIFEREGTVERAARLGEEAAAGLERLRRCPIVGDIRRCGLMIGVELVSDRATKTPFDPKERIGHQVILAARRRGMIIRPLGDVVVLMPPLVTTSAEMKAMVEMTCESIEEIAGKVESR